MVILDEKDLVRKLVTSWHLSVPERRALPNGKARGSLIYSAIEEVLKCEGWFPPDWRPNGFFNGVLIEYKSDGTCRLHVQAEVAYLQFEGGVVEKCSLQEAVKSFVHKVVGADIDGVPIDWSA